MLTFPVVSNCIANFLGQLPKLKLQLHNSLAVMVESIRIVNRVADITFIILGTGVFDPKREFFYQYPFFRPKTAS